MRFVRSMTTHETCLRDQQQPHTHTPSSRHRPKNINAIVRCDECGVDQKGMEYRRAQRIKSRAFAYAIKYIVFQCVPCHHHYNQMAAADTHKSAFFRSPVSRVLASIKRRCIFIQAKKHNISFKIHHHFSLNFHSSQFSNRQITQNTNFRNLWTLFWGRTVFFFRVCVFKFHSRASFKNLIPFSNIPYIQRKWTKNAIIEMKWKKNCEKVNDYSRFVVHIVFVWRVCVVSVCACVRRACVCVYMRVRASTVRVFLLEAK